VDYGSSHSTTRLDVYPCHYSTSKRKNNDTAHHPVIVFVYGGGWGSGDKKWYALLAQTLVRCGYVVVVPNYSLWPRGSVQNMTDDIQRALEWTVENIGYLCVSLSFNSTGIHMSIGNTAEMHRELQSWPILLVPISQSCPCYGRSSNIYNKENMRTWYGPNCMP
jgi:alpha/beta hydrolase fold